MGAKTPQIKIINGMTKEQLIEDITVFEKKHTCVKIMRPEYTSEKKLDDDFKEFNTSDNDARIRANTQALKYYGMRNYEVYKYFKRWYLTHDITITDPHAGEMIYYPGLSESSGLTPYDLNQEAEQCMKTFSIKMVTICEDGLDSLNKQYLDYITQTEESKQYADKYSKKIYGVTNEQSYRFQQKQFLFSEEYEDGVIRSIPDEEESYTEDVDSLLSIGNFVSPKEMLKDAISYTWERDMGDGKVDIVSNKDMKSYVLNNKIQMIKNSLIQNGKIMGEATLTILGSSWSSLIIDADPNYTDEDYIRKIIDSAVIRTKMAGIDHIMIKIPKNNEFLKKLILSNNSYNLYNDKSKDKSHLYFSYPISGLHPEIKIQSGENLDRLENARNYINSSDNIVESAYIVNQIADIKPNTIVEATIKEEVQKSFLDKVSKDSIYISGLNPYFTINEMQDMGVFSEEENFFYPESQKLNLGLSTDRTNTVYNWYLNYMARSVGIRPEIRNMDTLWYQTVYDLMDGLKDMKNPEDIASRKQSILELGWNPELPFDEDSVSIGTDRQQKIINEGSGFNFINSEKYGIPYLLDENGGRLFISFFHYSDQHYLVSVGTSTNMKEQYVLSAGQFSTIPLYDALYNNDSKIDAVEVYCIALSEEQKQSIEDFLPICSRYSNYSFFSHILNQIGASTLHISNTKLFCIHLINMLYEVCRQKGSFVLPMYVPTIASLRSDGEPDFIYKVYSNTDRFDEEEYESISTKAYDDPLYKDNPITEDMDYISPFLYMKPVVPLNELAIEFSKDGDILIKKKKTVKLDTEYANIHRLMMSYSKAKAYPQMKYYIAKLWYMNLIIEHRLKSPARLKNKKALSKYYSTRAHILADFKKYFEEILEAEPTFDFKKYYATTPYGKRGGYTIPRSVWITLARMGLGAFGINVPDVSTGGGKSSKAATATSKVKGSFAKELLKTGVQAGAGAAVSDAVSKAKFEELEKKLKEAERKNWIYEYMRTRMRHRVKQTPVGLENMRKALGLTVYPMELDKLPRKKTT